MKRIQNLFRFSEPFPSVTSLYQTPFLVANVPPNSPILAVCHSPANQVPCTNYATTYTGASAACPNGAQDTPDPSGSTSACQSTGDAQGNIAFWAPSGTYDYTVCIAGTVSCFGPYTVTLGGTSLQLQTNGTNNGSQTKLNLAAGSNITITDNGTGTDTIASTGGGGISGSCSTSNAIPVFASSTSVGCSALTDNLSTLTYSGTEFTFSTGANINTDQVSNVGRLHLFGQNGSGSNEPGGEVDALAGSDGSNDFGAQIVLSGGSTTAGGNAVIHGGNGFDTNSSGDCSPCDRVLRALTVRALNQCAMVGRGDGIICRGGEVCKYD